MFTKSELKDLALMIEDYRDRCKRSHDNRITTESSRRMYAREILKAETLIAKIEENVKTLEVKRNES